jgi:peptide/nickel transport system substrate-binding protein
MRLNLRAATAIALLIAISGGGTAFAQKQGGILRIYSPDSLASMSILEEATVFAEGPMIGGLQQPGHVRPACEAEQPQLDRARSGDRLVVERGRHRTDFPLRQGVKWHDGKPFTAAGVKCTGT